MKSKNQTASMFCSALAEISMFKDEISTDVLTIVLRNTPELCPWCFTEQELRAMVRILAGDPANDRMSRIVLHDLLEPPVITTTSEDDKNRSIIPDEAVAFSTAMQAATSIDDGQDREDNAGNIELTRQVDLAGMTSLLISISAASSPSLPLPPPSRTHSGTFSGGVRMAQGWKDSMAFRSTTSPPSSSRPKSTTLCGRIAREYWPPWHVPLPSLV